MRSYTLKSTLVMTTMDFLMMFALCYVLGLMLGVLPDMASDYWLLVGTVYLIKTAVWLLLRIPLMLPVDRWQKRGAPPSDNEPGLIRGIYYFPYDFSVFYGVLVFLFYLGVVGSLVYIKGPLQVSPDMMLPGVLFGAAIGAGAIAIGVPVNLLMTAKFSRRLSERDVNSFREIPGKELSLKAKVATVAIALGCAPSLLLFSIQLFTQSEGLYREAGRSAETVAQQLRDSSQAELDHWALNGLYPFSVEGGQVRFSTGAQPPSHIVEMIDPETLNTLTHSERRLGYVIRYTQGSQRTRGVVARIPYPESNYLALWLTVLLACLWPLVTSLLTVQTIVNPVAVISATFHRIIGRGRTEGSDRVPIFYKDEVGRLAFNANRTINVLTDARRELEKNSAMLEAKNEELQEAYRTKGEFLANMSHELRTPLNAIIGFSRLMKRKLKDTLPERQRKNLLMIEQSGEQLLVLVNDLLDFERIEAGKLVIRREPVSLEEFFESLYATLKPVAREKGLELVFKTSEIPAEITSDRERLRQVLTNLITNSIKYSDAGTVTFTAVQEDEWLEMEVADQGIGMTPDQLELIFDPFHQIDGSETRERGGVGLGLAIVGRLINLLKGTVTVESEKGKGSTFTVRLPLSPGTEHLVPTGTGAKVLVVDDNLDYLESIYDELTDAGFRVQVAESGEKALEILEEETPRVVLLDIVMPGLDGWEVLRRIRSNSQLEKVPVVITSVVDEKPVGLDLDIAGWLTKPLEFESLRGLLTDTTLFQSPDESNLLIVEDDPQTSQLLQQSFEEAGLDSTVVHTEEEAIKLLREGLPTAMVLDLNLDGGSGWNVLAQMKRLPGHDCTRVFVYTAADLGEVERQKLQQELVTIVHKHGENSLSGLINSIVEG